MFTQEKSYIGLVKNVNPLGEAEVGLNFRILPQSYITVAFKVLFPKESIDNQKVVVGGYGLRAGIGFDF